MPKRTPLLLAVALACSSGPDSLTFTPQQANPVADGTSDVTIRVTARVAGASAQDGTTINLNLPDLGSTDPAQAEAQFVDSSGQLAGRTLQVTTTGGTATLQLRAPSDPGNVLVDGSFQGVGSTVKGSATIAFAPPPLAAQLTFTCGAHNVGVLPGQPAPVVPCTAIALDDTGTKITSAHIGFLAEAGAFAWQVADAGNKSLVYTTDPGVAGALGGGAAAPEDVDPMGPNGQMTAGTCACPNDPSQCQGEPCWNDGSKIHNPRDGVVTLVAYVPGAPPSGLDSFGEPYVDANDNGQWDPGEPYLDVNHNGQYDKPSGQQVPQVMLWKAIRMVWSGPVNQTWSSIKANPTTITCTAAACGNSQLTLHLVDGNLNPLAAFSGSSISLSSTAGTLVPGQIDLVQDDAGMNFDAASGAIDSIGSKSGYQHGADYSGAQLTDTPPSPTSTGAPGTDIAHVTLTLQRTYQPGSGGQQASESPSIQAQVTFKGPAGP